MYLYWLDWLESHCKFINEICSCLSTLVCIYCPVENVCKYCWLAMTSWICCGCGNKGLCSYVAMTDFRCGKHCILAVASLALKTAKDNKYIYSKFWATVFTLNKQNDPKGYILSLHILHLLFWKLVCPSMGYTFVIDLSKQYLPKYLEY